MEAYATQNRIAISAGYAEYPCSQCGDPVLVDDHTPEPPTCPACRRALIEGEMSRIVGDIQDCAAGRGEWEFVSPVEKQRFLRRLRELVLRNIRPLPVDVCCQETAAEPVYVWDGESPDAATRDELEGRIELETVEA